MVDHDRHRFGCGRHECTLGIVEQPDLAPRRGAVAGSTGELQGNVTVIDRADDVIRRNDLTHDRIRGYGGASRLLDRGGGEVAHVQAGCGTICRSSAVVAAAGQSHCQAGLDGHTASVVRTGIGNDRHIVRGDAPGDLTPARRELRAHCALQIKRIRSVAHRNRIGAAVLQQNARPISRARAAGGE